MIRIIRRTPTSHLVVRVNIGHKSLSVKAFRRIEPARKRTLPGASPTRGAPRIGPPNGGGGGGPPPVYNGPIRPGWLRRAGFDYQFASGANHRRLARGVGHPR